MPSDDEAQFQTFQQRSCSTNAQVFTIKSQFIESSYINHYTVEPVLNHCCHLNFNHAQFFIASFRNQKSLSNFLFGIVASVCSANELAFQKSDPRKKNFRERREWTITLQFNRYQLNKYLTPFVSFVILTESFLAIFCPSVKRMCS